MVLGNDGGIVGIVDTQDIMFRRVLNLRLPS